MTTRLRIPNVTTAVRTAGTGAVGELVFDTDLQQYFQGTSAAGPDNWSIFVGATPSLTGVTVRQLDALPKQSEYNYTASTLTIDLNSSEDFLNSLGLNLVFSNNGMVAENTTFYLYNTAPNPLTDVLVEPDVIITFPRFGYNNTNLSGNRNSYVFHVDKGQDILDAFLVSGDAPNVDLTATVTVGSVSYNGNNLFGTLYSRTESSTGSEVLTYNQSTGAIDWQLPAGGGTLNDLTDVTISALPQDFTSVVNPINPDTGIPADYTTATGRLQIIVVAPADRTPFVVNDKIAVTLATTSLANAPTNILFTGTVTESREDGNLGEIVRISIDPTYSTFFTGSGFTGTPDGFAVPAATVASWRVWSYEDSDAGVAVFDAAGNLYNQSLGAFQNRLADDRVTFTTTEDIGETAVHTFTGVTSTLGGQTGDPDVITFHFASQDDAFSFFALSSSRGGNGVTTRATTVTFGSQTIVFPVGTRLEPAGGPDLDVLNRSVLTVTPGPLASQTTATNFSIDASVEVPVHATGNNFELIGANGVDVDLNTTTNAITISGPAIWQGTNTVDAAPGFVTPTLALGTGVTSSTIGFAQDIVVGDDLTPLSTLAVGVYRIRIEMVITDTSATGGLRVRFVPDVRIGGTTVVGGSALIGSGGYLREEGNAPEGGSVAFEKLVNVTTAGAVTVVFHAATPTGTSNVTYGRGESTLIIERLS